MQEDPFIKAIEENLTELEDHVRANRAHSEQGLYTEALPRILNIFRGFLDAIDSEEGEAANPTGAYLLVRYQTANTIEAVLTELFREKPENDLLAGALFLLLEDLYGITAEDAAKTIEEKAREPKA